MKCFLNLIQDNTLQIQMCVTQFANSMEGIRTVAFTVWHENMCFILKTK